jgi:hypothetical protein
MISRFKALSLKEKEQKSSYIVKAVSAGRCALNLLASSSFLEGTRMSEAMKWWAKKAKIVSVISIPFSGFRVQAALEKTAKSIDIDDHEGVLVNSLAVASSSADTLYSVSSVFNAFLDIIGSRPIQILADISMPLSFFMSGIDISSRTMQMSKVSKLYQEIDPALFLRQESTSMDDLRRRLQRRLDIRKEAKSLKRLASTSKERVQILTDRMDAKFSRLVPKSSQGDMKQLFEWLSVNGKKPLTHKQRQIFAGVLQKIRFDLEKKMAEDAIMMVAALVGVVSLTFFCMQGMGCLPYAIQMISTVIKTYAGVCVEAIFDVSPGSLIGKEA